LAKWQRAVAEDDSRFKVVSAGRRSGKTTLSIRQICYYARQPNKEIFYITSSYRAAKMIVWKPLKNMLLDLRWVSKVNESELSLTLKNGTTISLKGSEDPSRLRGVSLDYVVIDEAAYCSLGELWGEVIRPALADKRGEALFISTPAGKANEFYDMFQEGKGTSGWNSWQLTTLDAGFVGADEIEAARADMTDRQFKQEFEASFEDLGSRIAYAFEREHNVKPSPQAVNNEIIVGMDFNIQPCVASIMIRTDAETLHAIDEIEIWGSNTDEMVAEIKHRYPTQKIFVFPDPSGSRRQTSSGGRSDHAILANAGFIVKAPRKHDPVRDRINATNARLCSGTGLRRLFVSPNCKRTIESLEKHSYKQGTVVPDKDSGHDHMFDALSYAVAYLYPLRKTPPQNNLNQAWRPSIG
jgi:phage terminase large subunit